MAGHASTYHGQDAPSDRTPLLRNDNDPIATSRPGTAPRQEDFPSKLRPSRITTCCIALYFMMEMFDMVTVAPLVALFEDAICSTYYASEQAWSVRGSCKIEPVQTELAMIRGWKGFFDAVPVFVVAIPLGSIANRIGRKRVLACSLVGVLAGTAWILVVCSFPKIFPTRLAWLSSIMYLFGGGLFQANATVMLIAAESSQEKHRSRTMYYIYSSYLVTELIAPSIASVAMDESLWIAFGIGLVFLFLSLAVVPLLPETYARHSSDSKITDADVRRNHVDDQSSSRSSSEPLDDHHSEASENQGESTDEYDRYSGRNLSNDSRSFMKLFRERNILLSVPIFIVGVFRPATLNVLLQYTSIRFDWTLSRAALLISEVAAVNIVVFLVLLPRLIALLQSKFHVHPQRIDLWILQGSLAFLVLGALLLGVSPNVAGLVAAVLVFAAGFGCRVSMLALATSWVSTTLRARFFGAVQIFENIGLLISDPILQNVFAAALNLNRFWLPLPFFVACALYLIAMTCSLLIRLEV